MSSAIASPKKIPRIQLSPKIKQKLNSPHFNRSSTLFNANAEAFKSNPSVNPITKRSIKTDKSTYKKLVKLYGEPYEKNNL
jgi:2-cysteine adaptor domain.